MTSALSPPKKAPSWGWSNCAAFADTSFFCNCRIFNCFYYIIFIIFCQSRDVSLCKFTSLTKISSASKNSMRNSCCAVGNPLIFSHCYIWFCAFPQSIDIFRVENHWKRTIFRKLFGIIDKKTEISYNSKVCCVPLVSIRHTGVYHGETGIPTRACRYLPASCIRREVFSWI